MQNILGLRARKAFTIGLCPQVEYLDAKLGRRGHVGIQGSLPLTAPPGGSSSSSDAPAAIQVDVVDLETRIRNVYTGASPPGTCHSYCDASTPCCALLLSAYHVCPHVRLI